MQKPDLDDSVKAQEALSLYFTEIPFDISGAIDAILWFYRCGETLPQSSSEETASAVKDQRRAYCFEEDAYRIYSAFWRYYHIDLSESELHWWKFRALFQGLPSNSDMMKIMSYRTANLSGMDKIQKKHYEKMKKIYALKNPMKKNVMSLAERDQRMKDYVAKRLAEANAEGDKN